MFRQLVRAQVALLVIIAIGALADPCFETLTGVWQGSLDEAVAACGAARVVAAVTLLTAAAATLAASVGCLVFARPASRSVRSMLVVTTLIGLWCGLLLQSSNLAWQGKRLRLLGQLAKFESIARPLRKEWPRQDGELPTLGPFMAYPFGQPTTLILLTAPAVLPEASVIAVERTAAGALHFQLGNASASDWVEWHPNTSAPVSFTDGLGEHHAIERQLSLGHGWHLVRYASS